METSALSFSHPALLHLLWLLPLLVALYWWAEKRRRIMIGRIVAPKLRDALAGNTSAARRGFRAGCVLVALGLLIVTLAGPRLGYDTLEVPHKGRDVIIAMDVSRSMLAPDVAPTRLKRAQLLAEDIVGELDADRVGLVAFAGSAFLQAPLTLDHGAVLAALDELDTTLIPKGGTNIAAAIRTATEAFGKAEGLSRALIIISDGEELDADGLAAAKKAEADGIRIFTVGVGSPEGSEIPLGPGEFVRDPSGKIVRSRLDAARMTQIAEVTGGFYTPLDDNTARRLAVEGIGKMAEADITMNMSRRPIERYQWPLAAAIALLMLQSMIGERRRRTIVAAALWLIASPAAWSAPAGLQAYQAGDYEKARQLFEKRLQTEMNVPFLQPDAATLQFNAGTAAYRLKDYESAAGYFSRATLTEDPKIRSEAEFNLGNTLFRQGEGRKEDKEKTKTDWKNAISKYEAALKLRPDYKEARENKERVEQLLKELEKKQEQEKQQQQKQNQQNKDQKKQDQQKQDQQKQDQQKQDQQNKDQQNKDQQKQDQQGGENKKDEQQKGEQGKQDKEQNKDQQKQDQQGGENKKDEQQKGEQGEQNKDQNKGDKQKEQKPGEQPSPGDQQERENQPQPGKPGEKPAPVPEQSNEKKQGELRGMEPEQKNEQGAEKQAPAEVEEEGKMSEGQARALLRALQGEEEKVNLRERRNFQDVSKDW